MWKTSALLAVMASAALADGCPVAPKIEAEQAQLLENLQAAPNYMTARGLTAQLWTLWLQTPDEASGRMLDEGRSAQRVSDWDEAEARFDALIGYCPFYAEGYNQRAFTSFLRGNYLAALPDLDEALRINPAHVGALSGKALTLMRLGREDEGQETLRAALALNPWLPERGLLKTPAEDKL
ncbi:tetratricopeptide repeat protein [Pacificoceanicola onchidii]|uniref:tetratricopeptide repeat protein n=1 Tax=Pacificoceanicola onchidii TaxID=2562685 RepID=UPI0010A50D52|nr:tetratricopeptide repeat protein [Pacificoceanicola onchidii]